MKLEKQRAKDIFEVYYEEEINKETAKECALIAVDLLLDVIYNHWFDSENGIFEFYERVREEIKNI